MTDFHAMPDQELNEWIAKKKGYLPVQEGGVKYVLCGYLTSIPMAMPDYCADWKFAGELEEEGKFEIKYNDYLKKWHVYRQNIMLFEDALATNPDNLPRAIAEAWAVWDETKTDSSITAGDTGKDGEG